MKGYQRWIGAVATVAVAGLATWGAASVAVAATKDTAEEHQASHVWEIAAGDEVALPDARVGDRVVLLGPRYSAVVPDSGLTTAASTGSSTLTIHNVAGHVTATGVIQLGHSSKAHTKGRQLSSRAVSNTGQCRNSGFRTLDSGSGPAWLGNYSWRLSTTGRPKGMTVARFKAAALYSGNVWQHGRNPCSKRDTVNITSTFLGLTAAQPNLDVVNGVWGCGARDGVNVVGFLRATRTLATGLACTSWGTNDSNGDGLRDIVEADIALNTRYPWTVIGSPCNKTPYYVREVLTHEFGHAIGVAHGPAESEVMYPYLRECSSVGILLSQGDMSAANFLY